MIKFENGDMKKSVRNFQIILWVIFCSFKADIIVGHL